LIGQNLKSRIVSQVIGVVGILVARDDLVEGWRNNDNTE
jgi:hypothetical protein